jgi:hypothetical protein
MTLSTRDKGCSSLILLVVMLSVVAMAPNAIAQTPAAASGTSLKATLVNPSASTDVKIDVVRWSTIQEREKVIASLHPPAGRGAPAERADNTDPFGAFGRARDTAAGAAGADAPQAQAARGATVAATAAGGGGRGGRGGRGNRGDAPAEPAPFDPIASFGAALASAPTIGYLWTSENSGYSIKYAFRSPSPDGGERIILATNRPFSFLNAPAASKPEFMVIELRMDPKAAGEGKATINSKITADTEAKTIALENYAQATPVLRNVKR